MKWKTNEIDYLKRYYGKKPLEDIAKTLNRKPEAVKSYANRNGIYTSHKWTEKEEAYLEKWYGRKSNKDIAKSLKRSTMAVHCRSARLDLGKAKEQTDCLHVAEVGRLVGKHGESIRQYWIPKGLKAQKIGKYVYIKEKDLMLFMQQHPKLWTPSECEIYFFDNEPWFHKRLLEERAKKHNERWKIAI